MKVGDLVRWTYPGSEDIGIAVELTQSGQHMVIHWMREPEKNGPYLMDLKFLRIISESR